MRDFEEDLQQFYVEDEPLCIHLNRLELESICLFSCFWHLVSNSDGQLPIYDDHRIYITTIFFKI